MKTPLPGSKRGRRWGGGRLWAKRFHPGEAFDDVGEALVQVGTIGGQGNCFSDRLAATHGTDTSRLNDLNGLDLTQATVLAKGSELYVPAQP